MWDSDNYWPLHADLGVSSCGPTFPQSEWHSHVITENRTTDRNNWYDPVSHLERTAIVAPGICNVLQFLID